LISWVSTKSIFHKTAIYFLAEHQDMYGILGGGDQRQCQADEDGGVSYLRTPLRVLS
jgi:hypothetical protein